MKIFGYLDDGIKKILELPLWAQIIVGISILFIILYLYGKLRYHPPFAGEG